MSNIIDGIPFGMGYEKATKWEPGIQWYCGGSWYRTLHTDQGQYEREVRMRGTVYRRPLPIISQHPGAIPLEPGEELKPGVKYLMRNGNIVGPLGYDRDDEFPWFFSPLELWWYENGEEQEDVESQFDIIARFPREAQQEPEKGKEEKVKVTEVEIKSSIFTREHTSGPEKTVIPLSEAARIAQLPEVRAEVERQEKEREIKVGDWVCVGGKAFGKCEAISAIDTDSFPILVKNTGWNKREDCRKIQSPELIALLNQEIERAKGGA